MVRTTSCCVAPHSLSISHTAVYIRQWYSPNSFHPFPRCLRRFLLCVCVSIPALQIGSSAPLFKTPWVRVTPWPLFLSFWLTSLCITALGSSTWLQLTQVCEENGTEQGLTNIFCKEPDGEYFRFRRSWGLCQIYSVLLQHEGSRRQHVMVGVAEFQSDFIYKCWNLNAVEFSRVTKYPSDFFQPFNMENHSQVVGYMSQWWMDFAESMDPGIKWRFILLELFLFLMMWKSWYFLNWNNSMLLITQRTRCCGNVYFSDARHVILKLAKMSCQINW